MLNQMLNQTSKYVYENNLLYLTANDKFKKINIIKPVYDKLNKLLNNYNHNLSSFDINHYIYVLCYRYIYFGIYDNNSQLALNEQYKIKLKHKYNIDTELFASPINSYYENYYSLFPFMEKLFGSKGRFSNIQILESKYYFANPPFEEEIMNQVSLKYIEFMNKFNSKFIMTIPIWTKIPFNINSNKELYKDFMAFYLIIPYIKKIKIYKKNQLKYINYTTFKSTYVSDTYFIIIGI